MCGQEVFAALSGSDCRTPEALAAQTGAERKAVVKAVGRLIARGWAERAEIGCYRLTAAGAQALAAGVRITSGPNGPLTARRPPRRRAAPLYELIWRALRIRGKATIADLLELAGRDGRTAANTAAVYLRVLARAGYLRVLPRREPGTAPTSNGYKRYQLLRDTGPLAPVARLHRRALFDPNLDRTVWPEEAQP